MGSDIIVAIITPTIILSVFTYLIIKDKMTK
jgi:hypothetical protein